MNSCFFHQDLTICMNKQKDIEIATKIDLLEVPVISFRKENIIKQKMFKEACQRQVRNPLIILSMTSYHPTVLAG